MDLLNSLAGFLVGLLVGFTGIGGGALMTPLLILAFGVAPQTAVGTDLLFASLTKGVGVWLHGLRGSIDWLVLKRLSMGSLPMSAMTLLWLRSAPTASHNNFFLIQMLGGTVILTGVAMLAQPLLRRIGQSLRASVPERFKSAQPAMTIFAGAVIGFLVTLTSVGAGALGTVMLVYLYPYRLTPSKLVGTDIAHAIPLTLIAGLGHAGLGKLDIPLLMSLLIGSVPGIVIGAYLCVGLSPTIVRKAIAITLAAIGFRLILQ